jgi:HAD superfamily hydrolase (TIGR01450 family)
VGHDRAPVEPVEAPVGRPAGGQQDDAGARLPGGVQQLPIQRFRGRDESIGAQEGEWARQGDPLIGRSLILAAVSVGKRGSGNAGLAGVRALLLDMDGVLVSRGQPIPGAVAALAQLQASVVPFRIITNTSLSSRAVLSGRLSRAGIEVPAGDIVTALSATADRLAAERPGAAVYLLGSADAPDEFGGRVRLLSDAEVDAGAPADVVVVGDSQDRLTYENLDRAFRLIRGGAAFVAMHRNPWWLTPRGPTLDSGALVVGLEYATGRRASVAGKPTPTVFRAAFAGLAAGVSGPPLRHGQVAMVGDDLRTDLAPARRLGMRTVLVLTGKHGRADLAATAGRARGTAAPDLVAPSIVEVVAAVTGPSRE